MPRKVTAYACKFRCGRKVTTHRSNMAAHEDRCFWNPATNSCPTCMHEQYQPKENCDYSTGYPGSPSFYWCSEDHLKDREKIRSGCLYWSPRSITIHDE